MYLKGTTESRIAKQEEWNREMYLSGLEESSAAGETEVGMFFF